MAGEKWRRLKELQQQLSVSDTELAVFEILMVHEKCTWFWCYVGFARLLAYLKGTVSILFCKAFRAPTWCYYY